MGWQRSGGHSRQSRCPSRLLACIPADLDCSDRSFCPVQIDKQALTRLVEHRPWGRGPCGAAGGGRCRARASRGHCRGEATAPRWDGSRGHGATAAAPASQRQLFVLRDVSSALQNKTFIYLKLWNFFLFVFGADSF